MCGRCEVYARQVHSFHHKNQIDNRSEPIFTAFMTFSRVSGKREAKGDITSSQLKRFRLRRWTRGGSDCCRGDASYSGRSITIIIALLGKLNAIEAKDAGGEMRMRGSLSVPRPRAVYSLDFLLRADSAAPGRGLFTIESHKSTHRPAKRSSFFPRRTRHASHFSQVWPRRPHGDR